MQEIKITSGMADLLRLIESLVHSGYIVSISPEYGDFLGTGTKRIEYYNVCLLDDGGSK